jgi:antitoxin component YwqK of YwqJK toxin-antitoxin module
MCIGMMLAACDQFMPKADKATNTVHYNQLTAQKNYWDSIPGRVKVRDKWRPYRYYLNDELYTGKVADSFASGKPKLSGAFEDGYAVGPWRYYQDNDSLEQQGSFDSGYVKGEWRFYDKEGKEDTRLIYKRNGRDVSADTLMVVYDDGSRKEWTKDKTRISYPNGKTKSEVSLDGSTGSFWDINGQQTGVMNDYIKTNYLTHETTYYVAQGKHEKAFSRLMLAGWIWTEDQLNLFNKANAVTLTPMGTGTQPPTIMSGGSRGFNVSIEYPSK